MPEPKRRVLLALVMGLATIAIAASAVVNGRLNEADTCGRVGSHEGEYANGVLTDAALLREATRALRVVEDKDAPRAESALREVVVLLQRGAPREAVVGALREWWTYCDTPAERKALKGQPDWRLLGRPLIQ